MNWKQFWGLCEHKWKKIQAISVYDNSFGETKYPAYQKILLECEKCGDVKTRKT